MEYLPEKTERSCGLFSATMPVDIQKLALEIMNNHIFMSVGIVGAANKDIDQQFYIVPKKKKVFEVKSWLFPEFQHFFSVPTLYRSCPRMRRF